MHTYITMHVIISVDGLLNRLWCDQMTESYYIIRQIYRNSTFYVNRHSSFISLDGNSRITKITDLGSMDSTEIICDGCNSLIHSDEIISMFYLNDDKAECISRAECQSCYEKYFKEIPFTPNDLFNVCSRILYLSQHEEYKGILIDLQSANLYCQVWMFLNHDSRLKLELYALKVGIEKLFLKLWKMTNSKREGQ